MATVVFTSNLRRHCECPTLDVQGATVKEVLDAVFLRNERVRGYVLDDQSALRKHMAVMVDGRALRDRRHLTDPVQPDSEIYILQALSGG